jgi:hypothetical protein
MKRNRIPEEEREFSIIGDQYDDDDTSYLPLFDEGTDEVTETDDGGEV